VIALDLVGDCERARRGGPGVAAVASPVALDGDTRGLLAVRAAAVSLATEAEMGCDGPACEAEKDCSKGLGSRSSLLR
jgi:hypothetical protein